MSYRKESCLRNGKESDENVSPYKEGQWRSNHCEQAKSNPFPFRRRNVSLSSSSAAPVQTASDSYYLRGGGQPRRQNWFGKSDCWVQGSSKKNNCNTNKAVENEELKETYGLTVEQVLHRSFNKKFEFTAHTFTKLEVSTIYVEPKQDNVGRNQLLLAELQKMKINLNNVKEKLNEYELNDWHRHTCSTNPANKVMKYLRSEIKVEFLTQAWCKFYELVYAYKLVPVEARRAGQFYSVHLCEAPGAFIAALNHYLQLNYSDIQVRQVSVHFHWIPSHRGIQYNESVDIFAKQAAINGLPNKQWKWMANSLNPFYEGNQQSSMISDDRFMLQTLESWDFGPDMTGDITHPDYPAYLRDKCQRDPNFGQLPHLVTADGSFDCQDKPEEQENSVAWLHLKETLNALYILRKGGNFVLKMFTFFELDTVCLLILLSAAFQSVNVMKPVCSKEGNSEVYVVCREFKALPEVYKYMQALRKIDEKTHNECLMMPTNLISRLFTQQIIDCARRFSTLQIEVIERNINLYELRKRDDSWNMMINKHSDYLQEKLFNKFIEEYDIRPLQSHQLIVSMPWKQKAVGKQSEVLEKKYAKTGSHNDHLKRNSLLPADLLNHICCELDFNSFDPEKLFTKTLSSETLTTRLPISSFQIHVGKAIDNIRSSQFCHGKYMRIRSELIKTYGIKKYNSWTKTTSPSLRKIDEDNEKLICRVDNFYLTYDDNNVAQLKSYQQLLDKFVNVRQHDDFTVVGFPLLTQFNVDVLFVLRHFFEKLVFESPNVIRLKCAEFRTQNKWLDRLRFVRDQYAECSEGKAVISFLPITYITGSNNHFYNWIIDVNNFKTTLEVNSIIELNKK